MEIEFELLRLWVGEEVWNEEKYQGVDQPGEQESFSQQPGDSSGQPDISAVEDHESVAPVDQGELSDGAAYVNGKSDVAEFKAPDNVTTTAHLNNG